MSNAPSRSADAVARQSARGAALISFAKLWFMATGFLQPLVLTRLLGADGYGLYGIALSSVSILNNVVVTGSIQGMSRGVIVGGTAALRRGLALHAALGLALGLALALGASFFGAGVLGDAQVPPLLRVASVVVADYCVYAALVGALNGRHRYGAQAALDITFSTLRTGLILGFAAAGRGALGAVTGFALASVVITVLALAVQRAELTGAERVEGAEPVPESMGAFARSYGSFFAPVLLYHLALNLVLQGDVLLYKSLAARAGHDTAAVNAAVGLYKAAQNFAFMPYQLLIAVTFVVFPVVSRATLEGDRETTVRFVEGAMRFSAMALGAMLAVLAGVPRGVLRLAYRPPFDDADGVLRALSLGQGAFALMVVACTIILAAGRVRAATAILLATLAGVAGGDVLGMRLARADTLAQLEGVALGSAAGWAVGLVAAAWYVRAAWGTFLRPATALRVLLSTGVALAAAGAMPFQGKVGTLLTAGATVVVYVALLVLTGELGREELARVRRVVKR